jgi:hypothetical protein
MEATFWNSAQCSEALAKIFRLDQCPVSKDNGRLILDLNNLPCSMNFVNDADIVVLSS